MAMTELEKAARGIFGLAVLRHNLVDGSLHAVMTALTQAPPGWKLVPADLLEKIPVARAGLCDPISKEWLAEQSGYIRGYNRAREDAIQLLAAAPEYKEGE